MKALGWVLALLLASPALAAEDHKPAPLPRSIAPVPAGEDKGSGEPETQHVPPELVLPAFTQERVRFTREASTRVAAPLPALLRLRALETKAGEAVVELDRVRLSLKPGDLVGTDVVRVVDEGLLVLDRAARPGRPEGAAVVIVRFDASGRPRVRVVYEQDPEATAPVRAAR